MKAFLVILLGSMLIFAPVHAILGLEYGPALSKFYRPYYMNLKKGLEAEKGLEMAHAYAPMIAKGKMLEHGKGLSLRVPLMAKEKELGFEVGKGIAAHHTAIAKGRALEAEIGKGIAMHYPVIAKEKALESEIGKRIAMHYPIIEKEKAIEVGIGKGMGKLH